MKNGKTASCQALPLRGIKSWAEDDRPREKLLRKSRKALSDAELLSIIIGSGTSDMSALEVARNIMHSVSNNLAELSRMDVPDLVKFKAIGVAKAINIIAVMELGRRQSLSDSLKKQSVRCSRDAFEIMHPIVADLNHEECWVIMLKSGKRMHKAVCISHGSVEKTVAEPKIIFRRALDNGATSIILCHNHLSGNVNPSKQDKYLTKKCREAGACLDLPLLDHIIIADNNYFSFADENMI